MSIEANMRRHGFAPWRALHGAQGFHKHVKSGSVTSLVIMPVSGKSIQSPADQVLACYFDDANKLCSDRFYDSLLDFLQHHQLDTSQLHHTNQGFLQRLLPDSFGAALSQAATFVRRKLLLAR